MTVRLNTEYSENELAFLNAHNCEILSEIKLPKSSDLTFPIRMFIYGSSYIGEIEDEGELVWAVLSKFKDKYHWGGCYNNLETLEANL